MKHASAQSAVYFCMGLIVVPEQLSFQHTLPQKTTTNQYTHKRKERQWELGGKMVAIHWCSYQCAFGFESLCPCRWARSFSTLDSGSVSGTEFCRREKSNNYQGQRSTYRVISCRTRAWARAEYAVVAAENILCLQGQWRVRNPGRNRRLLSPSVKIRRNGTLSATDAPWCLPREPRSPQRSRSLKNLRTQSEVKKVFKFLHISGKGAGACPQARPR